MGQTLVALDLAAGFGLGAAQGFAFPVQVSPYRSQFGLKLGLTGRCGVQFGRVDLRRLLDRRFDIGFAPLSRQQQGIDASVVVGQRQHPPAYLARIDDGGILGRRLKAGADRLMRRRAVALGHEDVHERAAHGGLGPMGQALGHGIDLPHPTVRIDDNEGTGGGLEDAADIAGLRRFHRRCLALRRRQPLGLDDGGHGADHLAIFVFDRHGGDRDQHRLAGGRIGQQVLEALDGLTPQGAGTGQKVGGHGAPVREGDAPGSRMEPQAQKFGIAAAQQLVGGPVGKDELALVVRLDQGHGHGIQGFEQALVGALGGLLHQIELGGRRDMADPVGHGKPCAEQGHTDRDAGHGPQHQGPVHLTFQKHRRP